MLLGAVDVGIAHRARNDPAFEGGLVCRTPVGTREQDGAFGYAVELANSAAVITPLWATFRRFPVADMMSRVIS